MYCKKVEGFDDVGLDRWNEGDETVEGSSGSSCDEDAADEHHEFADSSNDQVTHTVAEDSLESVPGGHAEVLASEGDLDVCSLIDELNDSLDASQTASEAVDGVFETFVLVCSCVFGLLLEDLDHHLEELDDCQDERSEGETTEMISESHL